MNYSGATPQLATQRRQSNPQRSQAQPLKADIGPPKASRPMGTGCRRGGGRDQEGLNVWGNGCGHYQDSKSMGGEF